MEPQIMESIIEFELLNKEKFQKNSKELFIIMDNNMKDIVNSENAFEEDYRSYFESVSEGLKQENRNIILITFDKKIIGFFQYFTNNNGLFTMEEVQIITSFQGRKYKIFRNLYKYIFTILPKNIEIVKAYAHKNNKKSHNILKKLGLSIIDKTKSGNTYEFQGEYKKLIDWYNKENNIPEKAHFT
jgi:RimJ/RimL family protein N-acetyltransferase